MKKALPLILILCAVVIGLMTGFCFAWFTMEENMVSAVVHQANAPLANIDVDDLQQSGTLKPAEPFVDDNGVPTYINFDGDFDKYALEEGLLLEPDGIYIAKAASVVELTGKFRYEGKDDNGEQTGTRTLVVQFLASKQSTSESVSLSYFGFMFEAANGGADISLTNEDRCNFAGYNDVFVIEVKPAVLAEDCYEFKLSIFLAKIDDNEPMDEAVNGVTLKFNMNIIAADTTLF